MRIALLSDTHGHLDNAMLRYFHECDEIWHAGDFGSGVAERLQSMARLRGVFGNIDSADLRRSFPETLTFEVQDLAVVILHIGGYPGRYMPKAEAAIGKYKPGLFISGHSHILKVMPDKANNLLHINPGAAGYEGFHHMRTMITFTVGAGRVDNLKIIELGKRSSVERQSNILE